MTFRMNTGSGRGAADIAVAAASQGLPEDADLVIVSSSAGHDPDTLRAAVRRRFPRAALHISSSCAGSMTEDGVVLGDQPLSLVAFTDPGGAYGAAAGPIPTGDPGETARALVTTALARADRPGEAPALVWVNGAPGSEEAMMLALEAAFGGTVPIYGGSSADDDISGQWWVADGETAVAGGIAVTVMFPTAEVLHAFHSGYEPTDVAGVVTAGSGRAVARIDDRPASAVYDAWTGGAIRELLGGHNILGASTLFPLGVQMGEVNGVPYHRLIHPETTRPDGAMTLFAEVAPGTRLRLMQGSVDSLLTRAARVATAALATDDMGMQGIAGGLVTYCAGCMLAVQDSLDVMHQGVRDALPGAPFLGQFTFGEQGTFPDGTSCHGNLMISVVLFRSWE